jgi:hypothetical protein
MEGREGVNMYHRKKGCSKFLNSLDIISIIVGQLFTNLLKRKFYKLYSYLISLK